MRVERVSLSVYDVNVTPDIYKSDDAFKIQGTIPEISSMAKKSLQAKARFLSPVRVMKLYYKAMQKVFLDIHA